MKSQSQKTSTSQLRPPFRHVVFLGLLAVVLTVWPDLAHSYEDSAWSGDGASSRPARVAVVADGGARGRRLAAQLSNDLLRDGLEVVPGARFQQEAASLGINRNRLAKPAGIRRASAAAGVDRVLVIKVQRKRRRHVLEAVLYSADGRRLWSTTQKLSKKGAPSAGQRRKMATAIKRNTPETVAVASAEPAAEASSPMSEPAEYAAPEESSYAEAQEAPPAEPEMPGYLTEPQGLHAEMSPARSRQKQRPPLLAARLLVGGGLRRYDYETTQDRLKLKYRSDPYPESGVLVEAFPLRGLSRLVQGLGMEASFTRSFVASQYSQATPEGGQATTTSDTPVNRISVDARYRVTLSPDSAWTPTFGLRAGWGLSDFVVTAPSAHFVGIRHAGLRFGVEIQQPLIPSWAVIQLTAAYMPSLQVGAPEVAAYGANLTSKGMHARLGLVGGPQDGSSGFTYGLYVDAVGHRDTFAGPEPDAAGTADATSDELYLAAHGAIGYTF